MAAVLATVPGAGTRAAQSPFDGLAAVSDGELAEQRGGFSWGQFTFNFGFSITTIVQSAAGGQGLQVVTTFTMSGPGQIGDLQTSIAYSDDQTVDASGVDESSNVSVSSRTWYEFEYEFGFDYSSDSDSGNGSGSWSNVAVHGTGTGGTTVNGQAATSTTQLAPTAATPPTVTPPTPPTPTTVTPPTPTTVTPPTPTTVTPPTPTTNTPSTPTVNTAPPPPVPATIVPVTVTAVTGAPVTNLPLTVVGAPAAETPPTPTAVADLVSAPVATPAPTPVTATSASNTAPPPVPVAIVTRALAGGGQEISVGDAIATQIIQSVSGRGITSVTTNRLSNLLVQENISMDVMVGGARNLSLQAGSTLAAGRIGRVIGLLGLRR